MSLATCCLNFSVKQTTLTCTLNKPRKSHYGWRIREGGKSSSESLRALGNGRGEAIQGMALNASFVSIEHTSISINSTSISQTNGGFDGGGQLGGELDIAS